MKGYNKNVASLSLENSSFRKVLYTTKKSQLVVMSLKPSEEIGEETHDVDQIISISEGTGRAILNSQPMEIAKGSVIVVPAGEKHNIVNGSSHNPMKLYTVYTPPEHKDGLVHATKEEGEKEDQPFDGKTTE